MIRTRHSRVVLLGAGGHCRSCIDLIEACGKLQVLGIVDRESQPGEELLGYPILGDDSTLLNWLEQAEFALVAVGQIRSPGLRIRLYEQLIACGFQAPVILSPHAYVSRHAQVDSGTVVHHGAVINAAAYVAHNTIINSQALIEHDVRVGSHCHVSTGAKINGASTIGSGTFIGSGTVIGHERTIGSNCVIAAGSVVLQDLPDNTFLRQPKYDLNR